MRTLLLVALVAAAPLAGAQLFKCTGKDAKVTYQAEPCPDTATGKSVKAPPPGTAGSAGSPAAGAAKEGWTPAIITNMRNGCIEGGMRNARLAWERDARADPRKGAFPEGEYRSASEAFCACLARRVTTSTTQEQFEANPDPILTRVTNEALAGGECMPAEILMR